MVTSSTGTEAPPIVVGDRLRVCSGPRPGTLALERGRDDILATIRLSRKSVDIVAGDRAREVSATALGNALVVHEGETYELRLPKKGRGELRNGSAVVAELEMRHPDHGSVLVIDVAQEVPHAALLFAHAGTIAYGRGLAGRRKKRAAGTSWGKESALADVRTLVYLDLRTGGDLFSSPDAFGGFGDGGVGDGGGGGGDGGGGGGGN